MDNLKDMMDKFYERGYKIGASEAVAFLVECLMMKKL